MSSCSINHCYEVVQQRFNTKVENFIKRGDINIESDQPKTCIRSSTQLIHLCEIPSADDSMETDLTQAGPVYSQIRTILDLSHGDRSVIDAVDWSGRTALHYSCQHPDASITKALLDAGSNPEVASRVGLWTHQELPALFHALYHVNPSPLRCLLLSGANPHWRADTNDFYLFVCRLPAAYRLPMFDIDNIDCLTFLVLITVVKCNNCSAAETQNELLQRAIECWLALVAIGVRPNKQLLDLLENLHKILETEGSNELLNTFCAVLIQEIKHSRPLSLFDLCRPVVLSSCSQLTTGDLLADHVKYRLFSLS